jgi:hypothetical protein
MKTIKCLGLAAVLALAAAPVLAAGPMDCSKGPIWNGAARGFINGTAYNVDGVALAPVASYQGGRKMFDQYHFYLSSKAGQMLDITTVVPNGAKPDGVTMSVGLHGNGSEAGPGTRSIQYWSLEDKPRKLKVMNFAVSDATMQIVYGARAHGAIPMQIHFCVPSKRTEIAGTFSVQL